MLILQMEDINSVPSIVLVVEKASARHDLTVIMIGTRKGETCFHERHNCKKKRNTWGNQ
jgi:hypothetical protein